MWRSESDQNRFQGRSQQEPNTFGPSNRDHRQCPIGVTAEHSTAECTMSTGRRLGDAARSNCSLGASAEVGALYEIVFGAVAIPGQIEETRRKLTEFRGFSDKSQFNASRRRMGQLQNEILFRIGRCLVLEFAENIHPSKSLAQFLYNLGGFQQSSEFSGDYVKQWKRASEKTFGGRYPRVGANEEATCGPAAVGRGEESE
jgi:hypothetical protein